MKISLKRLAKELDFTTENEYFDYLIDSHINGNFSSCKRLFAEMRKEDQKRLIEYCDFLPEVRKYYFDLL